MRKYLNEIGLSASAMFSEMSRNFMIESRCVVYSIEREIEKNVVADFRKLAIKIWPKGNVNKPGIPETARDGQILIVNIEFDLAVYNSLVDLSQKSFQVVALIKSAIKRVPAELEFDNAAFLGSLDKVADKNFVYEEESGRWLISPSGKYSAKLKIYFDHECIKLIALIRTDKAHEPKACLFAEFDTYNPILDQLGQLSFVSDNRLKYTPKKIFDPIFYQIE